jgi:hypothetical protein
MAIIVGTGDFKYRIVEDWAKLPDGWSFKEVGAVGVDSRGDLYVGEVSWTQWPQFHPDTPRPAYIRSLQKYERVH